MTRGLHDASGMEAGRTVVLDTTVVIHLARAGRLDLLGRLEHRQFVIPDQVVEEVTYPEQAEALEDALEAGHLRRESCTDIAEITLYAELVQRMGKGEAACLAMAASRGWLLASDDRGRAFRRLVWEKIGAGRLMGTSAILAMAREQDAFSDEEVRRILRLVRE